MARLSAKMLHGLLEATRIIHDHEHGTFHDRLFRALDLVYSDSVYALELYGRGNSYSAETNVPFDPAHKLEILNRTNELVQLQSPMFQRLAAGETQPMRLSDFISLRELRRTDLYQEIFRPVGITRQIGIPIRSSYCLGGLTINRDHRDFTVEDHLVASLLAPQIATAFETDTLLKSLTPAIQRNQSTDLAQLRRLGLTRREAEIFLWMIEGKRDGEIAIILSISVRTVNKHVGTILAKLNAETRTAAVATVLNQEILHSSDAGPLLRNP
ncbi:helix-turn-helix transcriptional regulator [Phragmitibacter flavus]|uniref:Helix-turn-helix transcriptional regulator n=1 Tax=Phragmitibacter flavus TaxID=2576071 RepID=A0A5R8KIF9_9BACT|nr:helix-turn-helix transcriptional regulator [Phragmitibacter flavus]TLD72047.1 helix-turn-helix transcriptional regulator [Phragmitibacter flavus]